MASRTATTAQLFDYRRNVFVRYYAKEKSVYRTFEPEDVRLSHELSSIPNLAELFRSSPSAPSLLPKEAIEKWSLKSKIVDGTSYDEYDIVMRSPDRGAITLLLTIDRRSSLPYSFAITESKSHTTTCYFDYPSEGPSDEASLGIPDDADAREVDESSHELSRIKQSLQEERVAFDDYSAFAVTSHFDGPRALVRCEPKRVLRKGEKWRIDRVEPMDSGLVVPLDQNEAFQVSHE